MKFLVVLCLALVACSAKPGYYYGKPTLDRSAIEYPLPEQFVSAPVPLPHLIEQPAPFYAAAPLPRPLPQPLPQPLPEVAPVYPVYANQYHRQYHNGDTLGQYNFAYETADNSRTEARDAFGHVVGSYSYVDAEGKLQTVNYRADEGGFNVAGTNIPDASKVPVNKLEQVKESPEVAAAREAHLKAHEDFKAGKFVLPVAPEVPAVPAVPAVPELKPIEDEPQVAAAKKEFLSKYDAQVDLLKRIESGEQVLSTPAPIALESPVPVTDEPAVALAKKEHIELHKALSEHQEILKKLTPEPVEYVSLPYPAIPAPQYSAIPYAQYPFAYNYSRLYESHPLAVPQGYHSLYHPYGLPLAPAPALYHHQYDIKSVSPIVAEAKLHEPLITPVLLPRHETLVAPTLIPQPVFQHVEPTLKAVTPIVAEGRLHEPLIRPAVFPHPAPVVQLQREAFIAPQIIAEPVFHHVEPTLKSVTPIVAEARLHEPLIRPAVLPQQVPLDAEYGW